VVRERNTEAWLAELGIAGASQQSLAAGDAVALRGVIAEATRLEAAHLGAPYLLEPFGDALALHAATGNHAQALSLLATTAHAYAAAGASALAAGVSEAAAAASDALVTSTPAQTVGTALALYAATAAVVSVTNACRASRRPAHYAAGARLRHTVHTQLRRAHARSRSASESDSGGSSEDVDDERERAPGLRMRASARRSEERERGAQEWRDARAEATRSPWMGLGALARALRLGLAACRRSPRGEI
jgi:hypothetical protein